MVAGLASGVWKDLSELKNMNREGRLVFEPQISQQKSTSMYKLWDKAVNMCRGWVDVEKTQENEEKKPQSVVEAPVSRTTYTSDEGQGRPLRSIRRGPPRYGAHGGVVSVEVGEGSTLDELPEEKSMQNIRRVPAPHRYGAHGGVISVEIGEGSTLDETPGGNSQESIRRVPAPSRSGAHGGVVSVEIGEGSTLDEP